MRNYLIAFRVVVIAFVAMIVVACASIGRPEGGPRDVTPPHYVSSNPPIGTLNVGRNRFVIEFDENISLDDVTNKVVVSPAQKSTPSILALGRRIVVEFRDSLKPATTYTIDFGDAIKDLNEGNVLDGFSYNFSSGDVIDSLQISGMLFEARTLEPAQGMLVGAYSNLSDSAITTLPLERICRTNQYGQFTISNLAPGTYRVFALNDVNRDYHWDRSEDVAFCDYVIEPTCSVALRTDTVHTISHRDSVISRVSTFYSPNDVLLTWFNEGFKSQYLKDKTRPDSMKLVIAFAAPSDSLPSITLLNGKLAGKPIGEWSRLHASEHLDTLQYWITNRDVIAQDTLHLAMRYLRTDSAQNLSWTNDTVKINYRRPKPKKATKEKEKTDTSATVPLLTVSQISGATQEPYSQRYIAFDEPVEKIDRALITFETTRDSVWDTIPTPVISAVHPHDMLNFKFNHPWTTDTKYRLTLDSLAVTSIYGKHNKRVALEFSTRRAEEYSTLTFNVVGLDSVAAIVELLDTSDKVIRSVKTDPSATARFEYVLPGSYYARLFIDRNGNGVYDTGNLLNRLQPEEVYYYNKKINVKRNWEISQVWDIYALPVDLQKPNAIKKNKPKTKSAADSTEDEEDSEFSTGFGGSGRSGSVSSATTGLRGSTGRNSQRKR